MTDSELIDALGGTTAVARALGIGRWNTVSMWRGRGIPMAWRPAVLDLAEQRSVAVERRAFLRLPPRPNEAA
jgi:hypothetical protein